jgi:hypothetical protein
MVDRLRAANVSAIWLCDRGFHRVAWLKKLVEMEQHFVVRLQRDVTIHLRDEVCLLNSLELHEGERCDFGFVHLRADEFVRVRLVGVWATGAKEAWWLATDLTNAVSKIVAYDDRRMGIEEQFRDAKGNRFGLKLKWTQFTKAEFVERMYLLIDWCSFTAVDERGACGRRGTSQDETLEQDERGETISGARWFLLLADSHQAVETDHQFCARTLAVATLESLQVADGFPKVIGGKFSGLTACMFAMSRESALNFRPLESNSP